MFTIVEITKEADERSINHHGSERKVFDKKIKEANKKGHWFRRQQTNLGDIAIFFGKYILFHVSCHTKNHKINIVHI